jgi:hypothetical protein
LAIPYLHENKSPNLVELAKQTGIEHEAAKKLWAILKKTKKPVAFNAIYPNADFTLISQENYLEFIL